MWLLNTLSCSKTQDHAAMCMYAACVQVPSAPPQPHKPINTTAAAVDELITAVSTDAKLAEAFVRTRWAQLNIFDCVQYEYQENKCKKTNAYAHTSVFQGVRLGAHSGCVRSRFTLHNRCGQQIASSVFGVIASAAIKACSCFSAVSLTPPGWKHV